MKLGNIFLFAGVVAGVFFAVKYLEHTLFRKTIPVPFRTLIRDTMGVYFSVIAGNFIVSQFNQTSLQISGMSGGGTGPAVAVFTDNPFDT